VHIAESVDVVDEGADDLELGGDLLKSLLIDLAGFSIKNGDTRGDSCMAFPLSIWPSAIPIQVVARIPAIVKPKFPIRQ